jgi:Phosphotransferase enzyme family
MSLADVSDDTLPGLKIVADPRLFLPALTRAMADAGREFGLPAAMRIVRIRHRKGERAIVHAEFDFNFPDGKIMPASLWLHNGEKAARRGRKAASSPAKNGPIYEPLSGALVYFFPSDPYVPELSEFVSNPQRHSSALLDRLDSPTSAPELARFRPGIGATFRWADPGRPGAYVKIQKDCDARSSTTLLKNMHAASVGKSFSVPRPIGFSGEINAFAMEEVLGETLGQRLANGSPYQAHEATRTVLRALKELHECGFAPRLRKDRAHFISRAQSTARRIAEIEPGSASRAIALSDAIVRFEVPLAEQPAHCDLKLEHVVFSPEKVTFLDLDSFALADPLFDLAMLDLRASAAARAGLLGLRAAAAVRRAVNRAALTDYGTDSASRFAWLKTCAALQLAGHFAQNTGPHSAKLCRFALKIGEKSIAGAMPSTTTNALLDTVLRAPPAPLSESLSCV